MAAKSKFSLYENLFGIMRDRMSKPVNQHDLQLVFNEMIGRNNDALASPIPDKPVYMDRRTEKRYYELIGVGPNEIVDAVNKAAYIGDEWNTIRNPMYVSLLILVFVFKDLKKEKQADQALFLFSLYMYRNVRSKYYSRISDSTINIMNYTISRISYKSDLKKHGSVLKMIAKKNETFTENWWVVRAKEMKIPFSDELICKMVNDNYRRYSTTLNYFYSEFKKDSLAGNYMNKDGNVDETEVLMQADNVSFVVERKSQSLMGKFSLSRYPDGTIIKHVATMEPGCSMNNLRNIMNYAYTQDKLFEEMIRLILQTFFFEYKKSVDDIKGFNFLTIMRAHYKKQTKEDQNLLRMKAIIVELMEGSGITKKISKVATINECKRAIFLFFLIFIQRNI